jgi:hypothetical protein
MIVKLKKLHFGKRKTILSSNETSIFCITINRFGISES